MSVEVNAPQEFQGQIMAGLTKRHAIVTGTDAVEGYCSIYCEVSLAWGEPALALSCDDKLICNDSRCKLFPQAFQELLLTRNSH